MFPQYFDKDEKLFQERIQQNKEVEAESINNSSAKFCQKDKKWVTLKENIALREVFLFCFLNTGDINPFK